MGRADVRKVPEITLWFWAAKLLTTALGESISDYSVSHVDPVVAVVGFFAVFLAAVGLQLAMPRFSTVRYWLSVSSVAVFGTMCADVLHVRFHVAYAITTIGFAVALACVFSVWYATERTLSIHDVDRPRREVFYWLTVVVTFALGTAVGDLVATPLHLGYGGAALLFAGLLVIPLAAWRLGAPEVACFWTAYVLTRPLGASIADFLSKPQHTSGLGHGDGAVGAGFLVAAALLVAWMAARGQGRGRLSGR